MGRSAPRTQWHGRRSPTRCADCSAARHETMALDLTISLPVTRDTSGAVGERRRVSDRALAPAVRQLAVLIGAGVAVVDALRLVAEQAEERRVRDGFDAIARDVERGGTLAEAVTARRDVFPPLAASLV